MVVEVEGVFKVRVEAELELGGGGRLPREGEVYE